jgi:prepilin-type processing-associated H-X9-DG protein
MPNQISHSRDERRFTASVRLRRALTILELLVVISSISVLASILLPAVQSARETARNLECSNHLRQIGVACHSYAESHRWLPPGWQLDPTGRWAYGWAGHLLKFIDEPALHCRVDRTRPMDRLNSAVRSTTPFLFLCPSDLGDPVFPLFAEIGEHGTHAQESADVLISLPRANYVGVFGTADPDDVLGQTGDGVFIQDRARRFQDMLRGTSHVMMVGERTTRKIPSTWLGFAVEGEDAAGRIVGNAELGLNRDDADECEFDSRHPGHANFVWADGHVTGVLADIDCEVYRVDAQCR